MKYRPITPLVRTIAIASALLCAGCSVAPTVRQEFVWHHPAGGAYLFDYDRQACTARTQAAGERMGTDPSGPFFRCMRDLGYRLVAPVTHDALSTAQTPPPETRTGDVAVEAEPAVPSS
ncbi:MAG: hypothetical protein AAF648_15920 [Pseudomonadota bacterium]